MFAIFENIAKGTVFANNERYQHELLDDIRWSVKNLDVYKPFINEKTYGSAIASYFRKSIKAYKQKKTL
ncbi:MAG: hypothetical protein ACRC9X_06415 [Bacteroidales bacterium]